jgi:hypothetical protein
MFVCDSPSCLPCIKFLTIISLLSPFLNISIVTNTKKKSSVASSSQPIIDLVDDTDDNDTTKTSPQNIETDDIISSFKDMDNQKRTINADNDFHYNQYQKIVNNDCEKYNKQQERCVKNELYKNLVESITDLRLFLEQHKHSWYVFPKNIEENNRDIDFLFYQKCHVTLSSVMESPQQKKQRYLL